MLLIFLPQWRRNIQLFPNGTAQVMGHLFPSEARSMLTWLQNHLPPQLLKRPRDSRPPIMRLRNLVIYVQLSMTVKLSRFPHSSGCNDAFYEAELFPALQINKWLPIHVSVFQSGKCIITGLTDLQRQFCPLLLDLLSFLESYNLLL